MVEWLSRGNAITQGEKERERRRGMFRLAIDDRSK